MASPNPANPPAAALQEEDDEDDYMKMTFDAEPSSRPETSLQRRERLRREGLERGHVKSKAELAAEAEKRREVALSTSLLSPLANLDTNSAKDAISDSSKPKPHSKGLAMMAKMGFKAGGTLGAAENAANARAEPIRVVIKEGRGGIGVDEEKKRQRDAEEAALTAEADRMAKRAKVDQGEYRERLRREREEARLGRLVYAAQKTAERMAEEGHTADDDDDDLSASEDREDESNGQTKSGRGVPRRQPPVTQPLKSINVLWRGLTKSRRETERDHRIRRDMEAGLSRLPAYQDDLEDDDDKVAMGKTVAALREVEDLDDDDPELDEFEALDPEEKLGRLVDYLRCKYNYCFWCKFRYPDDSMEGCPGLTEEDHD